VAPGNQVSNPRIDKFRAAVAAEPESAVAHMRLGTALLKLGDVRAAEPALRRATELDPDLAEAWVNLGGLLLGRWDFAGCVEANRRAAAARPDMLQAHYNQGLGHLYLGQAPEMLACYQRVLELDPRHPGGTYHLAVAQLAVGEVDAARVSLARARELGFSPQPEFLKALERVGKPGQQPEQQGGKITTIGFRSTGKDENSRDRARDHQEPRDS
jgi:tetratricopeptide (TPR) repeat protein